MCVNLCRHAAHSILICKGVDKLLGEGVRHLARAVRGAHVLVRSLVQLLQERVQLVVLCKFGRVVVLCLFGEPSRLECLLRDAALERLLQVVGLLLVEWRRLVV